MNLTLTAPHIVIPYIKEFKALAGTVNGCLLFQQLNHWFKIKPDSFYKFQSPPQQPHPKYRQNDSWTEELGFSKDEFRAAFDRIGVRYFSKTDYDAAKNKFEKNGKTFFFCSYHDKIKNLTFYFRNDEFVARSLKELGLLAEPTIMPATVKNPPHLPEPKTSQPDLPKLEKPIYSKSEIPIPNNTEITSEIKNNNTAPQPLPKIQTTLEPVVVEKLEKTFSKEDLPAAKKKLASLPVAIHLAVLEVFVHKLKTLVIKQSKISYFCGIVNNAKEGTFTPLPAAAKSLSSAEMIERDRQRQREAKKRATVDNVAHFANLYKLLGGNFEVPEPYREAVFAKLNL